MAQAPDFQLAKDTQLAVNLQYQFNHDQTNVNLVITANGERLQGGGLQQVWLEHDLNTTSAQVWMLKTGLINYYGGSNLVYSALPQSDKLFMELHYSF
jgi:hypothetical protein